MVCATSKASDQPALTRSLIRLCLSLEYSMSVKLLTEHHLEFLSLKGGCTGSSEFTLVKMPHLGWKSNVTTQMRSEVKVMVTVTQIWHATLHHPKMHLGFLPQIMLEICSGHEDFYKRGQMSVKVTATQKW